MQHTVSQLVLKYLAWCKIHRSHRTLEWYAGHLSGFLVHLGDARNKPVTDLKPYHVVEWTDAQQGWGDTYKRGAISAVQRLCNWAEGMGYIDATPLRKIAKPTAGRRDNPMTPADYQSLLAQLPVGDPFRDLLMFVWHTGCRPQEARHIEHRHVFLDRECVVLPKEEAKGKRHPRVIYLDAIAVEILTRLMKKRKAGKLFRNTRGTAWEKYAICNRMERLSVKIGKSLSLYDARHGFCQRLLEQNVNLTVVAELMGHRGTQMVSTVYSHMTQATAHLREALRTANAASNHNPLQT